MAAHCLPTFNNSLLLLPQSLAAASGRGVQVQLRALRLQDEAGESSQKTHAGARERSWKDLQVSALRLRLQQLGE
jgi:GTP cyclohydrolase II